MRNPTANEGALRSFVCSGRASREEAPEGRCQGEDRRRHDKGMRMRGEG